MAEQHQQDDELEAEDFDVAASYPAMLFGLPYTLTVFLLFLCMMGIFFYQPASWIKGLAGDAIIIALTVAVWTSAKVMLKDDYHGWDNWLAYVRLDCLCLDTKEWGGAHLASLPVRSLYRCGAYDA